MNLGNNIIFEGSIIFEGITIIIGTGLLIQAFRLFKKKKMIENIPTSKVRSIAMGLVELNGKIIPIKTP